MMLGLIAAVLPFLYGKVIGRLWYCRPLRQFPFLGGFPYVLALGIEYCLQLVRSGDSWIDARVQ